MSQSSDTPGPDRDLWPDFDLRQFIIATIHSVEFGDAIADVLENRVTRIEEVIAAPWYRRWLLRRRLRREIRATVSTWDDDYIPRGDFLGRRQEWAMHTASERYDRRAWKPRFDQLAQDAGQDADDGQDGSQPGDGFLS